MATSRVHKKSLHKINARKLTLINETSVKFSMKKSIAILCLVLCTIVLGSILALHSEPALIIEIQLTLLDTEDPQNDAKSDITSGSTKCYQINGYAPYYPAIKTENEYRICLSAKTVNIVGTSDFIDGMRHGIAIEKAIDYATIYNSYIIENASKI
ncbi:hypothetical protein A9Q99_14555 [Gammaproteobacteria bacterium 45_16_T64]|nr:hypothetical protein A9Q99_14555 [Gammaproteobacteria bacterium 45_16_T64]